MGVSVLKFAFMITERGKYFIHVLIEIVFLHIKKLVPISSRANCLRSFGSLTAER